MRENYKQMHDRRSESIHTRTILRILLPNSWPFFFRFVSFDSSHCIFVWHNFGHELRTKNVIHSREKNTIPCSVILYVVNISRSFAVLLFGYSYESYASVFNAVVYFAYFNGIWMSLASFCIITLPPSFSFFYTGNRKSSNRIIWFVAKFCPFEKCILDLTSSRFNRYLYHLSFSRSLPSTFAFVYVHFGFHTFTSFDPFHGIAISYKLFTFHIKMLIMIVIIGGVVVPSSHCHVYFILLCVLPVTCVYC